MYYKKVIIESEADFPKEEGDYFCCRSGFLSVQHIPTGLPTKSFAREIRWYLIPVSDEEVNSMPCDEDIEKAASRHYPIRRVNAPMMSDEDWLSEKRQDAYIEGAKDLRDGNILTPPQ
jgi:hypothetical protein